MCLKLFKLRSNVFVADLEQTVEASKMNVSLSLVYVKNSQFINNARYYIYMLTFTCYMYYAISVVSIPTSQPGITCSKLKIQTLEQGVRYLQS